jgi:hypothetical protein
MVTHVVGNIILQLGHQILCGGFKRLVSKPEGNDLYYKAETI